MPIWNPSLAIGVPQIDSEHEELFGRTDALLDAMRKGSSAAELERLLAWLQDYCEQHFRGEARLMSELRYPEAEPHLAQHAYFRREYARIVESFRKDGPRASVAIAVQQLLSGWLVTHIRTVDTKLASFLAARRTAA